jgi:hypothetical protein
LRRCYRIIIDLKDGVLSPLLFDGCYEIEFGDKPELFAKKAFARITVSLLMFNHLFLRGSGKYEISVFQSP